MFSSAEDVLRFIAEENVEFIDVRFCDLPGTMQHFTVPAESFGEGVFTDGLMFDGSSIRGFQQIHESDMQLMPDPSTAVLDPFRTHKTLNLTFFVHDPLTGAPYTRDPRNIARKARGLPARHRHRRHRVLRTGGGVLHLRLGAVRHLGERGLLPHRLGRGRVEHRQGRGRRQPRLQAPVQGRLLPGAADGPLHGLALGDGPQPDQVRHRGRDAAPRGGHGRAGGDRHQVRPTAGAGRQADALQVRDQEHRPGRRQDRDVHAQAAVRRQRQRDALPPVHLEGRRAAVLRRGRLRGPVGHRAATTSAACSSTLPRCWLSPTRRRTPTTGWCPASRPRSTWSTRSATARPAPGSRSPARTRRPSASSSACPTRPATRTSRSPRC